MALTNPIKHHDLRSIRQAIQQLSHLRLGAAADVTFAGLTLSGLAASRLVWTDSGKVLTSKDLVDLVAGTADEIDITDDGDGSITIGIVDPLIVGKGGTGVATLTDHSILLGSGTGSVTSLGVATDGQLPIGSTGIDPVLATLTGTANQVVVANAGGSITLSTPQNIHTDATPEFNDVIIGDWQLGTPTYDSVHDWMNDTQSAGKITGGDFTSMGSGVLKVDAGTGLIKTTNSRTGVTLMFDWAENADVKTDAGTPQPLTDGATNYIYVDYKSGTPEIFCTTTQSDITFTDKVGLGRVYRDGAVLHLLEGGVPISDGIRRAHQAISASLGFHRTSGLATSETGDLSIAITEGTVWNGLRNFSIFAGTGYDSTATDFTLWYKDHTGWVSAAASVLTHHYNDYEQNPGLVATGAQQYGNFWVYLHHDGDVFIVYGLGSYKYAEALAAPSPANLPAIISDFSILVARITLKTEETSTFTTVGTPWDSNITSGTITDHDGLANLAFADAGHTGFQAQGDVLDDLNTLGAVAANSEFLVGTGAGVLAWESGATVRTSLGLTIGTNVQAWDASLDSIAALTYGSDSFIKVTAEDTYAIRTIAETKSDLSLNLVENTALTTWVGAATIVTVGTIATGTWQATDVGIAYGGTGQSTAQTAIDALSAVSGAANEHVLTKDTASGNAVWKAAAGSDSEKVKVDAGATADYLGAAAGDGALRTGNGLTYTDGGDFVTLTLDNAYNESGSIFWSMISEDADVIGQGTWTRAISATYIYNGYYINSTSADGDNFTLNFRCVAGTYDLKFNASKSTNRGVVDVYIDGSEEGSFDLYSDPVEPANVEKITGITIATTGAHTLKFQLDGKNGSSLDYFAVFQGIHLLRTA